MTNNTENFTSFKWETTNGTPLITAADSVTYLFGLYGEDIRITPPSPNQKLSEILTNQYKNPTLSKGVSELPTWKHQFHPVNCVPDMMFLGSATDATPDTLSIKHTGLKHSFTSRWEYRGGTNPRRIQSVGNYTIGMYGRMGIDISHIVEITNAWQKFESEADRVALTTAPIYPETIESCYVGLSEVLWDYGEAGEDNWDEIFEVEYSQQQNFTQHYTSKTTQIVYPQTYGSVDITFHAVLNQNTQWEDYIARNIKDVAIKTTKPNDITKYKQIVFANCQITQVVDTHIAYDGKVLALIKARAESYSVNFTHEGSNFATYYPAYA